MFLFESSEAKCVFGLGAFRHLVSEPPREFGFLMRGDISDPHLLNVCSIIHLSGIRWATGVEQSIIRHGRPAKAIVESSGVFPWLAFEVSINHEVAIPLYIEGCTRACRKRHPKPMKSKQGNHPNFLWLIYRICSYPSRRTYAIHLSGDHDSCLAGNRSNHQNLALELPLVADHAFLSLQRLGRSR